MKKNKQAMKNKNMNIWILFIGISIALCIIVLTFYSHPTISYTIYRVDYGQNEERIHTTTSFSQALELMKETGDALKKRNAYIEDESGKRIAIAFGVVNFNVDKDCGVTTSYQIEYDQSQGYTNGCYGADGLYLETKNVKNKLYIRFQQASAIGVVSVDSVELRNIFDPNEVASTNQYIVENGKLYHNITTNIQDTSYASTLSLGEAPQSLTDGAYVSYDGHYFYHSLLDIIQDQQEHTNKRRINSIPYYFHYQFMSQSTKSAYTAEDLNQYIENYLGFTQTPTQYPITGNASILYDTGNAFIQAQNLYQVNAIGMFGLACNESDFGRSELSYEKNNLFGHAAYDDSPIQSAASYDTIAECLQVHADIYMRNGYFNKEDLRFRGDYFGDKAGGMNVHYASDPYWGEKAGVYYMQLDDLLGKKDVTLPLSEDIDN